MRMWIAVSSLLLVLASGSASALPGISLSQPLPETAPGECPLLIQIKYPWLACKANSHGGVSFTTATVAANASWDDDRSLPRGHGFVEGHGYWKTPH